MSLNLNAKIDEIQCHQHADTSAALLAIRSQLQDLTKSVESCQSEVVEVKRDMVAIKHEIDTLQAAKEEIEELRDAVDRLEEQTRRRKIRLLEQVPVRPRLPVHPHPPFPFECIRPAEPRTRPQHRT
nr:uncharacterized protein LOC113816462 [Penaeus vannamei]